MRFSLLHTNWIRTNTARRGLHVVLLLILVVSSGCAQALPPVYKIGLVAPFEGPADRVGLEALFAARLALRELNDGALVRIELVALDSGYRSGGAAARLIELASDPDVIGAIVVAPLGSDAAPLATPPERRSGIVPPLLARQPLGTLPIVTIAPVEAASTETLFHAAPPIDRYANALVQAADNLGLRSLLIVHQPGFASPAPVLAATGRLAVGEQIMPLDASAWDEAALVRQLATVQPDALVAIADPGAIAAISAALHRAGFAGMLFVVSPARPEDWAAVLAPSRAIPVYAIRIELPTPAEPADVARFKELAGRNPGPTGRLINETVRLLASTMQQARTADRAQAARTLAAWSPSLQIVVEEIRPDGAAGKRIVVLPAE